MPHTIAAFNSARHMGITQALREASDAVGADFDYLLDTAVRESSLEPNARARTSSASGLFQFTEQTWLGVLKRHGSEHGLGAEAAGIIRVDGRYKVPDAAMRQAILALRNDPKTASLMAGEFTAENRERLETGLDRPISGGELYAAHVMGAGGAVQLIATAEQDPSRKAASLFPEAARANRAIFYENGRARSVAEVTDFLTGGAGKPAISRGRVFAAAMQPDTTPAQSYAVASSEPEWTAAAPAADGAWTGSLRGATSGAGNLAALGHGANILHPGVIAILASLDVPETKRAYPDRARHTPPQIDSLSG